MISNEELLHIALSRCGNSFTMNGKIRSVGFYITYVRYIELYMVDPERLAAGPVIFTLYQSDLINLIRFPRARAFDKGVELEMIRWVW